MNVSAEMYIVVSLMFAVFAAVAAVGTSIVLGVGFERLRNGFEIVKRQSGFFAEAIYKLDARTKELSEQTGKMRESVSVMADRVERVEKTTGFFSDAIHTLEQKILEGMPAQQPAPETSNRLDDAEPILPRDLDWITATQDDVRESHTDYLLQTLMMDAAPSADAASLTEAPAQTEPETGSGGLSNLLMTYFRSESRTGAKEGIVYH